MLSLCFVGVISASSAMLTNLTVRNSVESARPEGCLTDAQVNAKIVEQALNGTRRTMSGMTDCHDCDRTEQVDQQTWCQANLPFKCRQIIFPAWEFERVRTRWFYDCDGVTTVRCGPWSDIATADCCSYAGGQEQPTCGTWNGGPRPVILPECHLANP